MTNRHDNMSQRSHRYVYLTARWLACLMLVVLGKEIAARPQEMTQLDTEFRAEVVNQIVELITTQHVSPAVAKLCAEHIQSRHQSGAYAHITSPYDFASMLTRDLHSIQDDNHLRVEAGPGDPFIQGDSIEARRRMQETFRRENYGFHRIEFLDGMIGYLDLRSFAPTVVAGEVAVAAMRLLAETQAVIIDLRFNTGGSGDMVTLLASYFFDEPTHLCSFEMRGQETIRQAWTQAHLPGPRMATTPLFILTSRRTGSAAEGFAYELKHLGRAMVIGETTSGGGHTCTTTRIANTFNVVVPSGRPVHPVTGTGWEADGVKPHLALPANLALSHARLEALKALMDRAGVDKTQKARITWALEAVRAETEPYHPSMDVLGQYVGNYGKGGYVHVFIEGSELFLRHPRVPQALLTPVSKDRFLMENAFDIRVYFERDKVGNVANVVMEHQDYRRGEDVYARKEIPPGNQSERSQDPGD